MSADRFFSVAVSRVDVVALGRRVAAAAAGTELAQCRRLLAEPQPPEERKWGSSLLHL